MNTGKRLALAILSPLFVALLLAMAIDIGFVRTATHPAAVKRLVSDSGIYSSLIPNALAQTKTISTSLGNVPTSDPDIQKAARAALPPQYIQQNTEMAIDNIYQWLEGMISQPNFSIDLSGAKTLFANNIAAAVQKRLAALPPCTLAQSRALVQSGFDAYQATCLPRGVSPATAAEQVKAAIVSQRDFLKNTNLGAASIKNANTGQSVFEQPGVKNIPAQYQRAKKAPAILTFLTILTAIGIVFLSRSRAIGLRHVGISLLVIGLLVLVFAWGFNRAVTTKITPKIRVDNAIFQQDIRNLVTNLTQQIDKNYWLWGGIYSLMGAAAIGGEMYFSHRTKVIRLKPSSQLRAKP